MKSHGIRLLIIFGMITLVGIIVFQIYWVKKTYDISESHFNHTISVALFDVAGKIADYNQSALQGRNPVHQISSNYYIVEVNDVIDKDVLEFFLKREFMKRNMAIDFEYAIYDCHQNEMVFGRLVSMSDPVDTAASGHVFERCEECTYYFGINFPGKQNFIVTNLNVWFISSFIVLSVVIFFGWSLFLVFRQKRLSEIQRDFIHNMTHEFKTPISTIAISASVLMGEDVFKNPERLKNYAGIIAEQNNRLKEHVEKVLQVANIEKRRVKPESAAINIKSLILTIADSYEALIQQAGGTIKVVLDDRLNVIYADRFHLTNILVNLIDNAVKYCKDAPDIEIRASFIPKGLEITVSDHGIGIEKCYQKRIFEKFFRVPTGALHNVKGFGLGLHYVYHMVRSHGWSIRVESEPESGTRFVIGVPNKYIVKKKDETENNDEKGDENL